MNDTQPQKPKRSRLFLIKLLLLLIILIVIAVIGLQAFKVMKIKEYVANMPAKINPVTVIKVKPHPWTPVIEATGVVRSNQGAMLSSQAPGTVTAILVKPGQHVKKGDLLIELDSKMEKANLAAYQAQLSSVKTNFDRFATLLKSKSISQSDYDKAESAYKALLANIAATKAGIARRQIYAPFSGVVGIIQVNVGEYVTVGKPMVRVEDTSKSKIDFSLGQNELSQIHVGQQIAVTTDTYAKEVFVAQINAIEPAINTQNGLINIQATVDDNKNKLLSGMFVRLKIELATQQEQIVVPQVAVTYNMYGETLYRLVPLSDQDKVNLIKEHKETENIYRADLITVTTIDRKGNYAHLKQGMLKFDDIIVTGGQQRLSNGGFVSIVNRDGVGTQQPQTDSKL